MWFRTAPFELLGRAARRRIVWLGVPIALYLWTIPGPFLFDDTHLLLKAEAHRDRRTVRLALFEFAGTHESWRNLVERGTIPWWVPPSLRITFFRPIAEWSFYLDSLVFGRHAFGHRLVSLGWFALALLSVHGLFRRASGDHVHAGVATFLLGISQTAAGPVGFICNRADLIVLVGTTLAARAYWSDARPGRAAAMAAIGCLLAVLAKETAVALVGVFVLHELAGLRRGASECERARRRAVTLVVAGIIVAYLAFYLAGLKGRLSGLSTSDGIAALAGHVLHGLGGYLALWTTGFPLLVLWQSGEPGPARVVALFGFGLALVVVLCAQRLWRRLPGAGFFALWMLVFTLPVLLSVVEPRAAFLASVGWVYLLAAVLRPTATDEAPAPLLVRHWLLTANGLVSIICVLAYNVLAARTESTAIANLREYAASERAALQAGDTLVVLEARDQMEIPFAGDRLQFESGLRDVGVVFLTTPGAAARVVPEDAHTFRLESLSPGLFASGLHRLALGPLWRPTVGQTFRGRGFTAEIVHVNAERVTALRFRFDRPLSDAGLRFHPIEFGDRVRSITTAAR